jgi:hypothetical protein
MGCEHCHYDYGNPDCPVCHADGRKATSFTPNDVSRVQEYHEKKQGLLTARQLADVLKIDGLSADTIVDYANAHLIPCALIDGDTMYFRPVDAVPWLRHELKQKDQRRD